jgi:hypothetical protein
MESILSHIPSHIPSHVINLTAHDKIEDMYNNLFLIGFVIRRTCLNNIKKIRLTIRKQSTWNL